MLGIAPCGAAGRFKERDLQEQNAGGEFSWIKGLLLSLLAGVLSAGYGIAINDVSKPIVAVANHYHAGQWQGNIAPLFVNPVRLSTALIFTLYLARSNRTLGELTRLGKGTELAASLAVNYLLAILVGGLWYGQFFVYNLGRVRLGKEYEFTSWAILMIMIVLFSNILALAFREWKGCRMRTRTSISLAIVVLTAAVVMLTYGNYLGDKSGSARDE